MPTTARRLSLSTHITNWQNCTACDLHLTRTNVVFCRGQIPCDVLFIGEAPGRSEDVVGIPFVGPAGHELDNIIKQAFADKSHLRWALTNLVACIPLDNDNEKLGQPDHKDIVTCQPRLEEFFDLCQPKLVVNVGALVKKYNPFDSVPWVDIIHPAAILRKPIVIAGYDRKKTIITLRNAVKDL